MVKELSVRTTTRNEMVDVTEEVRRTVAESAVRNGVVVVYVPHTTAGVTINENADPSVPADIVNHLAKLVPARGAYRHTEGNSDAHIKSVLVGSSVTVPLADGRLTLGTWQGIFFCEFDGPRRRRVVVRLIAQGRIDARKDSET